MTSPRHRTPERLAHGDGVVEVRTRSARPSPVVIVSGATIVAVLVATAWIALRPDAPPAATPAVATAPAFANASQPARSDEELVDASPRRSTVAPSSIPAPARTASTTGTATPPPKEAPAQRLEAAQERAPAEDAGSADARDGSEPGSGAASGLAAFPPLGSKPIQRGIVVPEGFELPPGFVRHYQTTDDGQMLAPILRFHPDHQPLDGAGRPVPMPPDRVVPPELAPQGMPIQMLEIPASSAPPESR